MWSQLSFFPEDPRKDFLFFGILPNADTRTQIAEVAVGQRLQHGLKGWPLHKERFHISLIGFGEFTGLPEPLVSGAMEAADTIEFASFDVTFDRITSFKRKKERPLVLRGDAGLTNLIAFQRVLGDTIQSVGLGSVKTQFRPHVTLLYDNRVVQEQPIEPISWTVHEFVLIHSLRGKSRYIPLGRWSLH
jgi:2'-5' RNA ligase